MHTIHLCKSGSLSGKAQTKVWCKVKWMVEGDGAIGRWRGREGKGEKGGHEVICATYWHQCLRSTSDTAGGGSAADAWNG